MPRKGQTYRAAVIGLGFMGCADPVSGERIGQTPEETMSHAHAFVRVERVELVAGSSRDAGKRERFTQRLGVTATYADWREMIEKETLDIVGIATNTPVHAEITIACSDAGIPCILCDKPLATRLSDADRMIEACAKNGTLLAVNHQRRWDPTFAAAREAIARGDIGDVYHVFARWPRGRMGNVGTHFLDLTHFLLDTTSVAVSGCTDQTGSPDCRGPEYHDPGAWGVVTMANGVRAFLDCSENITGPLDYRIGGAKGQLVSNGGAVDVQLWDGAAESLTVPEGGAVCMDRGVDELVECLDKGSKTSVSSGEDARAALEAIVGFHMSDKRGARTVELPLTAADREYEIMIG